MDKQQLITEPKYDQPGYNPNYVPQQPPQYGYAQQPQIAYVQTQPGYMYQPQQQVIVVAAPAACPQYGHYSCEQKAKSGYGVFRIIQAILATVQLGLTCAFLAYAIIDWYYWLWLIVLPGTCLGSTLSQLFNRKNHTWAYRGGSDIAYAILWICHGIAMSSIFFIFYLPFFIYSYEWYYMTIASLTLSGLLQLTYWITGCSACSCKCLECNMPRQENC